VPLVERLLDSASSWTFRPRRRASVGRSEIAKTRKESLARVDEPLKPAGETQVQPVEESPKILAAEFRPFRLLTWEMMFGVLSPWASLWLRHPRSRPDAPSSILVAEPRMSSKYCGVNTCCCLTAIVLR
jgi:hypothetical protein